MADKCDPIRSKLHDLEVELKNTDRFLAEPETSEKNPPKPRPNPIWIDLVGRIAKTRLALQACAESLLGRRWTVTGDAFIGSFEIDAVVLRFMKAHAIRAMSVAFAREGTLTGNRGYTWAEPNYPITQPDTLFRVASVSKIFTCAAHRGDGKRFVVHADEKLTAFVELEAAIRARGELPRQAGRGFPTSGQSAEPAVKIFHFF